MLSLHLCPRSLLCFFHLHCLPLVLVITWDVPLSADSATSFAQIPVLQWPFMVGPGFSPVLAKLVSQIIAGKFVELNKLLSSVMSLSIFKNHHRLKYNPF